MPPGDAIARAKIRMIEQFADEALRVPDWLRKHGTPFRAYWRTWIIRIKSITSSKDRLDTSSLQLACH